MKKSYELCPYCDRECKLPIGLGIYTCPSCGKQIINCNMCSTMDCATCPIIEEIENGRTT